LDKKKQKSNGIMYCNLPIRIKNFLTTFFPKGIRKDVINRALYFYFLKGYYKELSPFFEEEDFLKIEQEVKKIFKKSYLYKSKSKSKTETITQELTSTDENLEESENKTQEKKQKQIQKTNTVNTDNIDFEINDEEYINEFDY